MEPFTLIALGLTVANLFGGVRRRDALKRRNQAASRTANAREELRRQGTSTLDCAVELSRNRIVAAIWLLPRVQAAYRELGMSTRLYSADGFLKGRTQDQVNDFMQKLRASFIRFEFTGDAAMLAATSTALVLKGLSYLDKINAVHVPVLHQTLNEAVAQLPVDHPDAVAYALGPLGATSVSDLVADSLIFVSALRLVWNARKVRSLAEDAEVLESETSRLEVKRAELLAYQRQIETVGADQAESTYQAYRAVVVASACASQGNAVSRAKASSIIAELQARSADWWAALHREPKVE